MVNLKPADGGELLEQWNRAILNWQGLTGDERAEAAKRVFAAGIAVDRLPVKDVGRVLEMLGITIKTLMALDDWARVVWNKCAQETAQSVPVSVAIMNFLQIKDGDSQRALMNVDECFASAVRRIQTLIGALGNLPRQYSEKFAPEIIESEVGGAGKANFHMHCWQAYVNRCGGREAKSLSQEISDFWPIVLDRMEKSIDASGVPELDINNMDIGGMG